MRKYGIFGILFLSLCLCGAVHTAYAAEEEESLQITQEELLDEFDLSGGGSNPEFSGASRQCIYDDPGDGQSYRRRIFVAVC